MPTNNNLRRSPRRYELDWLRVGAILAVFVFHKAYLERITHHQFSGSFFAFIPHYFVG